MPVRKKKNPKEPKAPKPAKTPKKRSSDAVPSSAMRKSTRASNRQSYADLSDSEGEVDDDDIVWRYKGESSDDEANKENVGSSSPTSDPTPAAKSQAEDVEHDDEMETEEAPTQTSARKNAKLRVQDRKTKDKGPTKKAPAQKKTVVPKHQPARGGRSSARNAHREKDIMDIPSDSDE